MIRKYFDFKTIILLLLFAFSSFDIIKSFVLSSDINTCNVYALALGMDYLPLDNFKYMSYYIFVNFAVLLLLFSYLKKNILFNRDFYLLRMSKKTWIRKAIINIFSRVVLINTLLTIVYIVASNIYNLDMPFSTAAIYYIASIFIRFVSCILIISLSILYNKYILAIYSLICIVPYLIKQFNFSFLKILFVNDYLNFSSLLILVFASGLIVFYAYKMLDKNLLKIYEMR
ncbi:MAG: hypothetical protein RR489_01930 [Clostridia bacterium]